MGFYRGFKCHDGETERSNFWRLLEAFGKADFKQNVYIIGDMNIDMSNTKSKFYDELHEWCDMKSLTISNVGVTRSRWVVDQFQESSLDIAISNTSKFVFEKEHTTLSDHYIMKLTCQDFIRPKKGKSFISVTNWNFDYLEANRYLRELLENMPLMTNYSVHEMDYGIRASLSMTYRKFVRSRELVIRDSHEVTSIKIVRLKNRRNRLRKKWLKSKTAINFVNMVRETRLLRKEVRRVRKNLIRSNMSKSLKHFWQEINKLRGVYRNEVDSITINGEKTNDLRTIAGSFIDHFTNKVNNLLKNYVPYEPDSMNIGMEKIPLTEKDVGSAFSRLSNKKSSGMDGLSGFFIKIFLKVLTPFLTTLFNMILDTGIIPSTWKIAKIIPVHKKGDINKVENFRPVSNINSISKVFELTILQRFEQLDQDLMLGSFQHGFRKEHGTDTAIAEVVNMISEGSDEGDLVGVYLADLTAAFDLLQKEKLVEMLIKKGVPDYLVRVIHSYLSDRVGYVQTQKVRSCVKTIKAGCVQGSILGPVLFNIYNVNNLLIA